MPRSFEATTSDERHVIREAEKTRGAIAESVGLVEIDPPQGRTGEDMIEVHTKPHETGGRKPAQLVLAHPIELREGIGVAALSNEVVVDG